MKAERIATQVLAVAAIVALLAVGSAAYTIAGGADADTVVVIAHADL